MSVKVRYFEDEIDPILKGQLWLESMKDRIVDDDQLVAVTFNKHPFHLAPICRPNGSFLPINYLKIIPSYYLVDPMAMVVAREIEYGSTFFGLRRIWAECDRHRKDFYRIYCEVACGQATYLVGHSTNFSGHGKKCKEHMDCLLDYLSDRFKLQIQEVNVTFDVAEPVIRKIE